MTAPESVVIIGAGPAGLTAAYSSRSRVRAATILESDSVVGGISRTVERDGWRFDIGGHRFFTKVTPVDDLWFEILGEDEFLQRPRMSRISYQGKLYDYPLVPMNALRNLGPVEAVRCVGSYAWVRVQPPKDQSTLEGLLSRRASAGGSTSTSSRPTPRRSGACRPPSSPPTSAPSGSRTCRCCAAGIDALTPKRVKARRGKTQQIDAA